MKTSVIRYRVADFLREHSPFDVMSLEDLLGFAGGGRVVFHEDDIYLFRKGETRATTFWVVQQGKIEMLDELPAGDQLRDVLGPGDLIGLRRRADDITHHFTAHTATEVILYAFDMQSFETLASKYPEAERYLTAHRSAAARFTKALQAPANRDHLLTDKEKASWLNAPAPKAEWLTQRLATCPPHLPIREAASQMVQSQTETLAVVAPNGNPLGLITQQGLLAQIATGLKPLDAPAADLMNSNFVTAPTERSSADYLLEMLRGHTRFLALTDNGSKASPLRGIVTDAALAITCGKNPVALMGEMRAAKSVAELVYLAQRAETFLSESLAGPSVIERLAQMLSELQAALVERLVRLAEKELSAAGFPPPGVAHGWLLFGKGGRREQFTFKAPELGLVYADQPLNHAAMIEIYFSRLAHNVAAKLEACSFSFQQPLQTRSLSEWADFYRQHMRDPIGNQIYAARDYFDFYVVSGEATLGAALQQVIVKELESDTVFIPVLANDTIANLPPLTFYQGFVLETDGRLNQTLDVEKTVLTPVTDAARMLAFAERNVTSANTLERLQQLAKTLPQFTSILTDAAEAWRIVSYHHTLAELSQPTEHAVIYPARLSRFEQRLLKSAFDSTRRFVELAASLHSLTTTS